MEQDAAWKRLKVSVLVKREKRDWGPFVSRSPTISLGSSFFLLLRFFGATTLTITYPSLDRARQWA